jgi:hypothetical protein
VELSALPLQSLIGPVPDSPDSVRIGKLYQRRTGRHRDAEVDGTICRILARFRAEVLVMIETQPGYRHLRHAQLNRRLPRANPQRGRTVNPPNSAD